MPVCTAFVKLGWWVESELMAWHWDSDSWFLPPQTQQQAASKVLRQRQLSTPGPMRALQMALTTLWRVQPSAWRLRLQMMQTAEQRLLHLQRRRTPRQLLQMLAGSGSP